MPKKKIRVGFDFDGVIAYNPLRVIRSPITFFKRKFLGHKKTAFTIPKGKLPRYFWKLAHETSYFPSKGANTLQQFVSEEKIEAYLISGRFGYLEDQLYVWLKKHNLATIFKQIHLNKKDEQPHQFKEKTLDKLKLDMYVEDNWDIVEHLSIVLPGTRVYWITNLFDRFISYPYKYNSLEEILQKIISSK